ncbi:high frequency lysogenization protein HflD [Kitasatospora sp. NBC_01250]|uniref:nickel/cobalt transporter n=1 Tax=Kitasatospora sp. NBC_01250 TaxID=2903571 RepID=UPI002E37570C|nr:high frequency lysogenization protein HflD [Kitasatospora sp. NBC_01250]
MTYRHHLWRAAAAAGGAAALLALAPSAVAHPLGNFSVNHYTGLTLHPDRVEVLAVTDSAEIPTLQEAPEVHPGAGTASDAERAAWARARCAQSADRLRITTPAPLHLTVRSATFDYQNGQAGLRTSRLECRLEAPADLTAAPLTLRVDTGVDRGRVGWNEITARGEQVRLTHSTVPDTSPSRELRDYPRDLLDSPRGDTSAELTAQAGGGASAPLGMLPALGSADGPTARVEQIAKHLSALTAARHLTVPLGLLAVLLSIALGAGHALLPGHGKTVMAAYLAGRRGRPRDALTVGATVTLTHTAGVLVIGMLLTVFTGLAGDTLLGWLGVASGTLVALVGAGLLIDAVRQARRSRTPRAGAPTGEHPHQLLAAVAAPAAGHAGDHAADQHETTAGRREHQHADTLTHDHDHADDHDREGVPHQHEHRTDLHLHLYPHDRPHRHGLFGHRHTLHHDHSAVEAGQPFTTRGLIGLGIAGGLVPSPSALVVLLGAIALGRTVFGATLVLAYGLGMAATLTAVGLALVRFGDRLSAMTNPRLLATVRRIAPHAAALTAALVVLVGLGLTLRSLYPLI